MAYDERRGRVVLFGGHDWQRQALGDTWEWDGQDWSLAAPAGSFTRSGAAMTFDPTLGQVVMFGGGGTGGWFEDLMAWDGTAWTPRRSANRARNRSDPAMAFDRARARLVLYETLTTWLHGSLTTPQTKAFGVPCAGVGEEPRLVTGIPFAGNRSFHLDVLAGPPASACVFGLASDKRAQDVGGCTLYLAGAIAWQAALSNAAGFATTTLAIPADRHLRGTAWYAQAFVLDSRRPGATVAATAGARIVIGD